MKRLTLILAGLAVVALAALGDWIVAVTDNSVRVDGGAIQAAPVALRSDGIDDHVDTGIVPQDGDTVLVLGRLVSTTGLDLFGASETTGKRAFFGANTGWYCGKGATLVQAGTRDTNWHFFAHGMGAPIDGLLIDGSRIHDTSAVAWADGTAKYWIFGLGGLGASGTYAAVWEVARLQYIRGATVIADMQANADGTFHDVVRGGRYGNGGSGKLGVVNLTNVSLPEQSWQ